MRRPAHYSRVFVVRTEDGLLVKRLVSDNFNWLERR